MEGDPEEGFTYLIGFVVYDGERVERHSLWSDDRKGEAEIFSRFLDIVARYDAPRSTVTVTTKGASSRACAANSGAKSGLTLFWTRSRTCSRSSTHISIFRLIERPEGGGGLPRLPLDRAGHFGIESVVWRKNWERTGDASWKARLIQYNLEDCDALRSLVLS